MRIRGKIGKAAIAAAVAASTFGLCSPLFAQERPEPSNVVVYGDGTRDWVDELQRFVGILDQMSLEEDLTFRGASLIDIFLGRDNFGKN